MPKAKLVLFLVSCCVCWAHAFGQQPAQELVDYVAAKTSRSAYGAQTESADGSVHLDLAGAGQHLSLAKLDKQGEIHSQCVGSTVEATAFLSAEATVAAKELSSPHAHSHAQGHGQSPHGISPEQYARYVAMIKAVPPVPERSASLVVLNADGANEGFNSAVPRTPEGGNNGNTLGAQRLNVFNRAAQIWGAFLDSNVVTQIEARFDPLAPCSSSGGVLGGAGATSLLRNFTGAPFTNTFYPAALANKLRDSDIQSGAEIVAQFNSDVDAACLGLGTRFYYGLNESNPAGTINLLVVVLHELGHGLGFASYTDETTGAYANGAPDIWARFMFDSQQNRTWLQMSNAQRAQSAVGGTLFWDSPSVRIAAPALLSNGTDASGRVRLFAPNPLQQGSSVSHFDTSASPNLLMEPAINPALGLTLDLTRQHLRDIGWFRDTDGDGAADSISNVLPSGSSISAGSATTIQWSNTGGFNKNVVIELSLDGGSTFAAITTPAQPATGVANSAAQGSFVWNVPTDIRSTQARIRVREVDFADLTGVSSANFTITAPNSAPNVSLGLSPTRQQGSPGTNAVIATISDAQTPVSALTVSTFSVSSGLILGTPSNNAGTVSISIAASCGAVTPQSFGLRVSDGSLSTDRTISVTVSPNTPPEIAYAAQSVGSGASASFSPSSGPSDNGAVTMSVFSTDTYQGAINIASTGVVTLSNARPAGTHTLRIRALDNCNSATIVDVPLTVNAANTAPSFAAVTGLTRAEGVENTVIQNLGTISDDLTAPGSVAASVVGGGTAVNVELANLSNMSGQLLGSLSAACGASSGTVRVQLSDGLLSSFGEIAVEVLPNAPPLLGSYPTQYLAPGAAAQVAPSAPPSDAGGIVSSGFSVTPAGFTGRVLINASTGLVNLSEVAPQGNYRVTIFLRDNCNAAGQSSLDLSIDPDRYFAGGFE